MLVLCSTLEVSRSGFYAWLRRKPSLHQREDERLAQHVVDVHDEHRQRYGSVRVHRELVACGHRIGRHRVARLMRVLGLRARSRKRWRAGKSAKSATVLREAGPNLLKRKFSVDEPNRVWVADITHLPTREGTLYLAAVLDLHSRFVVGWATSRSSGCELPLAALRQAVQRRRPGPGLIHHSDRGVQYRAADFQHVLAREQMRCSMSRKGNCWDNAPMESFFGTLKNELMEAPFATRASANAQLFEYIELFYNRRRRHSTLGYQSPAAYELGVTA